MRRQFRIRDENGMSFTLKPIPSVRCLVTGALGFIGSNLALKLVELGADITLLDAMLDGSGANPANIKEIKNRVRTVTSDVRDLKDLRKHVRDSEIVFHCAAQVSRVRSIRDPRLDTEISCLGTINVLEAARLSETVSTVVFAGSRAVMGHPPRLPAEESMLEDPIDIYSANKLAAEKYCKIYNKLYGLRTTTLRINNCYGPRGQMRISDYGVINWFIAQSLQNEPIPIYGNGSQLRDFVYVDDVVNALVLSAQKLESSGEAFFVGSGVPTSLLEVAKLIAETTGLGGVEMVQYPDEWKAIEIGNIYCSIEKIRKLLGWSPQTPLRDGIKKTVDFYRTRLQAYL
jgi:UDP-glucose 4-epimerase